MIKHIGYSLLGLCVFSTVYADDEGDCTLNKAPVPVIQIEKTAQDLGYQLKSDKKIKMGDGCTYKVKAKDKDGHTWKLYFDPNNGNFIGRKKD